MVWVWVIIAVVALGAVLAFFELRSWKTPVSGLGQGYTPGSGEGTPPGNLGPM
jgi:amino acid transporter